MKSIRIFALCVSVAIVSQLASATDNETTSVKLAEGVYVILHRNSPDGNVNANTTVIIGDRGVFVIDSCFVLSEAQADISRIREWTDKPIRYLVNTHWHNDHNMGNGVYKKAFPALEVIAQVNTAHEMYRTPNTRGRFVRYVAIRRAEVESGKDASGKALDSAEMERSRKMLAGRQQILSELDHFVYQAPTLTFQDALDFDLGNRIVQVRFLGRGTTSGDTIVYLPKEKILVTGDLITSPVLFTFDGYPTEWIRTLNRLALFDVNVIVPGHGAIMHDNSFLYLCRDLLQSAVDQVSSALHELTGTVENPSLDEVRKHVDLTAFRSRFAGEDQEQLEFFDQASDALVRIVYNEARHNAS